MNNKEINLLYHLDNSHWWHLSKYFFVQNLNPHLSLKNRQLIIDLGCGSGGLLEKVKRFRPKHLGIDSSPIALSICIKRHLKVAKMDLERPISLKGESASDIFCLDTLEHVKNDLSLLQEACRLLKKNGHLTISVPAHPRLFSYWDRYLGHFRRYSKSDLEKLVESAGFKVTFLSHFFFFTLPLLIMFRYLNSRFNWTDSDFVVLPEVINRLAFSLCKLELKIAKLVPLPVGSTMILTAIKK